MKIIVSDTGPLIILSKINRLDLLHSFFTKVLITPVVFNEITAKNDQAKNTLLKTDFIQITDLSKKKEYLKLQKVLDDGEASGIALAKERSIPLLIDEKKGRKIAKQIGIEIIGFLGVLLLNYRKKNLNIKEVEKILEDVEKHNYRIGSKLKNDFIDTLK